MKDYKGGTRMRDAVETIGKGTLIQHGKHNDRIYLMKFDDKDSETLISEIESLASSNGYSKLFCKIPKHVAPLFFAHGYILEGYIPRFYNKERDVYFVSKFLNSDRLLSIEREQLVQLSNLLSDELLAKPKIKKKAKGYSVRKLKKSDVEQITQIYLEVFESYPFPIHNPGYIVKTMGENVQYFGVEKNGQLAALASSEIDFKGANAEMTDFATHPEHVGNNLSVLLLKAMEKEMKSQGISTLYTIARLNSIPMNKTFLRNTYHFSGTLIKNTNIAGKIESMNIYYKHI
jgi:putative beta-lysine N-acetyltransferase